MNDIDIYKVLQEELNNIAPEIDMSGIDRGADLREAMDIDSMDFLNFISALHRRFGIDIPEIDYPKLVTLDGAIAYLRAKLGSIGA
jgi:acyl carrier protein